MKVGVVLWRDRALDVQELALELWNRVQELEKVKTLMSQRLEQWNAGKEVTSLPPMMADEFLPCGCLKSHCKGHVL